MNASSELQQKVRDLIGQHCAWLGGKVPEIEQRLGRVLHDGEPDCDPVVELRELVHQIAGASGTMGFAKVSAAARELESQLETMARTGEAQAEPLTRLVESLKQEIAEASPLRSTLYNKHFYSIGGVDGHA